MHSPAARAFARSGQLAIRSKNKQSHCRRVSDDHREAARNSTLGKSTPGATTTKSKSTLPTKNEGTDILIADFTPPHESVQRSRRHRFMESCPPEADRYQLLKVAIPPACILVLGLSIGVAFRDGSVSWLKLGAESVLYFALMLAVWSSQRLRKTFGAAPRRYALILGFFVTLAIASQIIGSTPKTYPFTRWTMYSDRSRGAVIFDFKAIHASGKQSDFLPVTGFLPPRTFNNTLQYLLEAELGQAPGKPRWPHQLATTYREICQRVAMLSPGAAQDPVVRIEAWRCRIKADTVTPENTVQRELVHELHLNEAFR